MSMLMVMCVSVVVLVKDVSDEDQGNGCHDGCVQAYMTSMIIMMMMTSIM